MIKAILYDLDGVLVDACEWHYLALNKALNEISKTIIQRDEHISIFNGLPTKKKLEKLNELNRVKFEDNNSIYDRKQYYTKETIIENGKIDELKKELHEFTKSLGILSVCVTNSITETAKLMLETTGQLEYMSFLISNEMVSNPKPHAEGYIRAMISLGFMPNECIIVEDSPIGLQAAKASGAHIWQVNGCGDVTMKNFQNYIKFIG